MPRPSSSESSSSSTALRNLYQARRRAVLKTGLKEGTPAFVKAMAQGNKQLIAYAQTLARRNEGVVRSASQTRPSPKSSGRVLADRVGSSSRTSPSRPSSGRAPAKPNRSVTKSTSSPRSAAGAQRPAAPKAPTRSTSGGRSSSSRVGSTIGKAVAGVATAGAAAATSRSVAKSLATSRGTGPVDPRRQMRGPSVSGNTSRSMTVRQKVDALDRERARNDANEARRAAARGSRARSEPMLRSNSRLSGPMRGISRVEALHLTGMSGLSGPAQQAWRRTAGTTRRAGAAWPRLPGMR